MKKFGAFFLCVCTLLAVCGIASAADKSEGHDLRAELTGGMWHAMPSLGSAWAERLAFLDDSTFIYAASQMDGKTRERFVTGKWSVSSDGLLTLLCSVTLKLEGGEVVPSPITRTEIVNAEMVRLEHDPAKKVEIQVGDYVYDDSFHRPRRIRLIDNGDAIWRGDEWWWKYGGDLDLNDLLEDYESATLTAKFVTEITKRINPEMGEFIFRLETYEDEYERCYTKTITIVDAQTGETIQTIVTSEFNDGMDAHTFSRETLELIVEDMNFDGYDDIRIMAFPPAGPNIPYICWLWDKGKKQFVHHQGLSDISSPEIDKENKWIRTSVRISAASYREEFYGWVDGSLTLIRAADTTP